jgi:hypothetical protein
MYNYAGQMHIMTDTEYDVKIRSPNPPQEFVQFLCEGSMLLTFLTDRERECYNNEVTTLKLLLQRQDAELEELREFKQNVVNLIGDEEKEED